MARADRLGHHRAVDDREGGGDIVPDDGPETVRVEDAPSPSPPSPGRRPLRRRSQNKVIAGVCGGLADQFGVSVLGLRVAFGFGALVVAFLVLRPWLAPGYAYPYYNPNLSSLRALVKLGSSVAVLAYFAIWVFVPSDDAPVSAVGRVRRRMPRVPNLRPWIAMLALVLGASLLGSYLDLWSADVTWAFLLVGVGVLLFRRDAERARTAGVHAASPAGATGPTPPPATSSILPGSSTAPPAVEPAEPRAPRERSPLGWLALGIALLVVGVTAILQNLGALDPRLVRYPAIVFVILGAGMMVGAFVERARWLVLPAILIVPALLVLSVIHVPLEGGFGKIAVYARSPQEVAGSYRRVAGDVFVDLTRLQCTDADVIISESTGFGNVTLGVPFDAHVVATGSVGIGETPLSNRASIDQSFRRVFEPRFGDGPTITANLQAGLGSVDVWREYVTRKQGERRCS